MRRLLTALLALAVLTGLTGCLSVPRSGPVVSTQVQVTPGADNGFSIVPAGPADGASPAQIVDGFLDAMQAAPLSTTVARQFLSSDLASSWDPSRRTITYTDKSAPSGDSNLAVQLLGANWLDARGAWRGLLPGSDQLDFALAKVNGQWRITSAPDALVVPESWFDDRFTQVSLYFFDPTVHVLVPEPVFVPRGSQLATTLVRDLLNGPSGPAGVLRSFLPTGGSEGLSVPVTTDGIAQVDISSTTQQNERTLGLMRAQLAWTLRQDPTVQAVQITVDDPARPDAGAGQVFPVTEGLAYDPTGYDASNAIFGLRSGVLGMVGDQEPGSFLAVTGPWAVERPVGQVRVDLTAGAAAGVTTDGTEVLTGPLGEGTLHPALSGTRFLPPAWDFSRRLWTLDRTRDGAVVRYLPVSASGVPGAPQTVRVPGVSGADVRSFLVSRDGTRLVAVVHDATGDDVVLSRLMASPNGTVARATRAVEISDAGQAGVRFVALAWASPTSVYAVQQLPDSAEVRALAVDGSGYGAATLTVGDRIAGLVSSPVAGDGLYAVGSQALLDLSGHGADVPLLHGVTSVSYVG
jgi:hypothetical protein